MQQGSHPARPATPSPWARSRFRCPGKHCPRFLGTESAITGTESAIMGTESAIKPAVRHVHASTRAVLDAFESVDTTAAHVQRARHVQRRLTARVTGQPCCGWCLPAPPR